MTDYRPSADYVSNACHDYGRVAGLVVAVDGIHGLFVRNLASFGVYKYVLHHGGAAVLDESATHESQPTRKTCNTHINLRLIVSTKSSILFFLFYSMLLYPLH